MTYYRISSKHKRPQLIVDDVARFTTPYYAELFVRDLKRAIPAQDRSWDGESKTWTVTLEHLDTLRELAIKAFVNIEETAPISKHPRAVPGKRTPMDAAAIARVRDRV